MRHISLQTPSAREVARLARDGGRECVENKMRLLSAEIMDSIDIGILNVKR